jgi:hypothetical protein
MVSHFLFPKNFLESRVKFTIRIRRGSYKPQGKNFTEASHTIGGLRPTMGLCVADEWVKPPGDTQIAVPFR